MSRIKHVVLLIVLPYIRPGQINFLMFGFAGSFFSLTKLKLNFDVRMRNDIKLAVK